MQEPAILGCECPEILRMWRSTMTTTSELQDRLRAKLGTDIPDPVLHVFRGIGQVFFQENALTGACFALGIAFGSLPMAIGAVVGSAIGTATARLLKFDASEL